jgi:ribosomal-protein-alanine N-acetyltransferase
MDRRRGLTTQRLRLRRWEDSDLGPFASLNADPEVMRYFPAPLTVPESNDFVQRIERHFELHGFGLWAVDVLDGHEFAGFVGLWSATFEADFTPAVEVGWRLARQFWGRGIASEAATAALTDGFNRFHLPEVVSFTATINHPSRRVMEKLGMTRDPADDFDHPAVAEGSPLRHHVLHRMTARTWQDRVQSRLAQ